MRTPLFLASLLAFCATVACGSAPDGASTSAGSRLEGTPAVANAGNTTRLRVVAANLSTGNDQSYDPGEGGRILQGLQPDVVLIQEFNFGDGSPAAIGGFVTSMLGASATYARDPAGQIPNGIISKYPILQSGTWKDDQTATRGFAWARIDVPGDKDLWAISLHLLTTGSSDREAEAVAIVAQMRATIPDGDLVTLGGDFNTGSRGEACIHTFGGVLDVAAPYPADGHGNQNTSGNRSKPHDWVLTDHDLRLLEVPVAIGAQTFPNGLVFDSRVFSPIADVTPARQGDSGASNMQHMAVVRDFALPAAPVAPAEPTPVTDADASVDPVAR